jgi:hypothetical protein
MRLHVSRILLLAALIAAPAVADPFSFSTGNPDGKMAAATRPDKGGKFEIEVGDDFILTAPHTSISSATFTGLVTVDVDIGEVRVEIFRVFPKRLRRRTNERAPDPLDNGGPKRVNSPSDAS